MFGMDGELVIWAAPDGRNHADINLGGMFEIVQVWDGENGWMLDQNGKVQTASGAQLKDVVSSAYLASWSHLLPGRMNGKAEYLGEEEGSGLLMIRILPAEGTEATYYLDPETHLPVKSEQMEQERVAESTYSNWTEFEGIRFAASLTQMTGHSEYASTFELQKVEFHQSPPKTVFAKPIEEADDYRFASGNAALDIPMELNGVHIFVQVSVNGSEPLWFIMDTGASVTVVEAETAKQIGIETQGNIEARGAGEGSVSASFASGVTYDLAGVTVSDQKAVIMPLRQLEPYFGREIDGVLGYDLISRFVMQIDYDRQTISLYDQKSYQYSGEAAVVPMRMEGGHPHVTMTVTPYGMDPIEAEFLIDTGAGSAIGFARPFVEEHSLLETLPDKYFYVGGSGVGGEMKSYVGRIESANLGGYVLDKPICDYLQDKAGVGAKPHLAGIIGGSFSLLHITTF